MQPAVAGGARMKKAFVSCGFALLLMSACTPAETPQALGDFHHPQAGAGINAADVGYGLLGPGPANYGVYQWPTSYRYDGEANFSPSFRTLSPDRPDLGDDRAFIQDVVAREDGVNPGMVIIAGRHAWVTVHLDENIDGDDKNKKLDELEHKIQTQVPRYQIHLNRPS